MSLDRTSTYQEKFLSLCQKGTDEATDREEAHKARLQELETTHPHLVALLNENDEEWMNEADYRVMEGSKAPKGCFFLLREPGTDSECPNFKLKVIDASARKVIDEILDLRVDGRFRSAFYTEDDLSKKDD